MVQDYCTECPFQNEPINQMSQTHQMMCGGYPCDMEMPASPMQMPYNMQMRSPMPTTMQPMPMGNTGPQMQNIPQMPNIQALPSFPTEDDANLNTVPTTQVISNINFIQGYLRTKIGSLVKVDFLIGTNILTDRQGTLVNVGISFIILKEVDTNTQLLCDIYAIRFVRFFS